MGYEDTGYELYYTVDEPFRGLKLRELPEHWRRRRDVREFISDKGERFPHWAVKPLYVKVVRR